MDVTVIDTGTANLASVLAGLRRAGATPTTSIHAETIAQAERLVLPGVGSFAAGMDRLRQLSIVETIAQRVDEGRPLLAVCLGLQLLCATSDESPDDAGVGVVDERVGRFDSAPTVPQLGWNRIEPDAGCQFIRQGYGYYANSYRLKRIPEGWCGAHSMHGEPFVAALERGGVLACQFHPELSGRWGTELLRRWLEGGATC